MGDDAIKPTPRQRGGCLKWTCGCLVVTLVIGLVLSFWLWRRLQQWDPEKSPWENLPRATTWAVEVHDLQTLSRHLTGDPGFARLLGSAVETLSSVALDGEGGLSPNTLAAAFEDFRAFAWLHRIVIPNAFLLGGRYEDIENNTFIILQQPAFFHYLFSFIEEGEVMLSEDKDTEIYYAVKDGWLIIGLAENTVRAVLDDWDSRALPLGAKPDRRDAYLALAARSAPLAQAAAPSQPGHFTLADPFASVPSSPASAPSMRMLLLPDKSSWRVAADVSPVETWEHDDLAAVFEMLPEPEPLRVADFEAAVSVRLAPDLAAQCRGYLNEHASATRTTLGDLLRDGWLYNASDDVTLLAAAPVVKNEPYPGLPVAALGWTVRDGVPIRDAADDFADALERMLTSFRAEGGGTLLDGVRSDIAVRVDADNAGGEIDLPPIPVSGARPGWRFVGERPGFGWFATERQALNRIPAGKDLPLADLSASPAGTAEAAGAWVLSREFIDGLSAWLRDRMEMTSFYAEMSEKERRNIQQAEEIAARLAAAYPRAAFRIRYDSKTERWLFKASVPYGKALGK